ncbi:MAG: GNAT family N-acetyltransferase [Bacillota bacterium]|jgi:predicted GNAT family acetyltransferase
MDFIYEANRIFLNDENGRMIAEITFPEVSQGVVNINHTYVDACLRGQGVAGQLMQAALEKIKQENKKVYATCSYAISWLEKNPEYADISIKSV